MLPHLDAAYSLARYLLGDAADADDVVQEACLRAMRHIAGFRGDSTSARAWLLAIVRNTAWTWRRRERGREALEFDEAQHSEDRGDHPETDAIRREAAASIEAALAALRPSYREVIVLREVDGLSYKEISDVVGVPIGTVMSRLSRARTALQTALRPRGER